MVGDIEHNQQTLPGEVPVVTGQPQLGICSALGAWLLLGQPTVPAQHPPAQPGRQVSLRDPQGVPTAMAGGIVRLPTSCSCRSARSCISPNLSGPGGTTMKISRKRRHSSTRARRAKLGTGKLG